MDEFYRKCTKLTRGFRLLFVVVAGIRHNLPLKMPRHSKASGNLYVKKIFILKFFLSRMLLQASLIGEGWICKVVMQRSSPVTSLPIDINKVTISQYTQTRAIQEEIAT
jgi:hypothetical protein